MQEAIEKPIAKFDWRSVMSAKSKLPEKHVKALDDYFSHFVAVEVKDNEIQPQDCVNCGKRMTGLTAMFGGGGFEWGIQHGVGHCANCKWPAYGHHFITDADGEEFVTLRNFILQVHPDFVDRKSDAERNA